MSKAPGKKAGKSKVTAKAAAPKKAAVAKRAKTSNTPKPPVNKTTQKVVASKTPTKIQPAKTAPAKPVPSRLAVPQKSGLKVSGARTIATAKPLAPKKTESVSKKMAARAKSIDVVLPPDYRPSDSEPFMNEMHRAYFRKRLQEWKDDIVRQTRETLAILHEDSTQHADIADRATSETDRATELRTRDRQRKLIAKIDAAIGRIDDGSYGFCEDTGEPIGLKRLDARPIATLSVEAQERHERREKVYREE
jgi:DnaK suppressor protein